MGFVPTTTKEPTTTTTPITTTTTIDPTTITSTTTQTFTQTDTTTTTREITTTNTHSDGSTSTTTTTQLLPTNGTTTTAPTTLSTTTTILSTTTTTSETGTTSATTTLTSTTTDNISGTTTNTESTSTTTDDGTTTGTSTSTVFPTGSTTTEIITGTTPSETTTTTSTNGEITSSTTTTVVPTTTTTTLGTTTAPATTTTTTTPTTTTSSSSSITALTTTTTTSQEAASSTTTTTTNTIPTTTTTAAIPTTTTKAIENGANSGGGANLGAVIGGIIGAIFIAAGAFLYARRRNKIQERGFADFDKESMVGMHLNQLHEINQGYCDFLFGNDEGFPLYALQDYETGTFQKIGGIVQQSESAQKGKFPESIKCKKVQDAKGNNLFITQLRFLGSEKKTNQKHDEDSEYAEIGASGLISKIEEKMNKMNLDKLQDLILRVDGDNKILRVFSSDARLISSFKIGDQQENQFIITADEVVDEAEVAKLEVEKDIWVNDHGNISIDEPTEAGDWKKIDKKITFADGERLFLMVGDKKKQLCEILKKTDGNWIANEVEAEFGKVEKRRYNVIPSENGLSFVEEKSVAETSLRADPKLKAWEEGVYEISAPLPKINGSDVNLQVIFHQKNEANNLEKYIGIQFSDLLKGGQYLISGFDNSSSLAVKVENGFLIVYDITNLEEKITSCKIENGNANFNDIQINLIAQKLGTIATKKPSRKIDFTDDDYETIPTAILQSEGKLINMFEETIAAVEINGKKSLCAIEDYNTDTNEIIFAEIGNQIKTVKKANLFTNEETGEKILKNIALLEKDKFIKFRGVNLKINGSELKYINSKNINNTQEQIYLITYQDIESGQNFANQERNETKETLRKMMLRCKVNGDYLEIYSGFKPIANLAINQEGNVSVSQENLAQIDRNLVKITNENLANDGVGYLLFAGQAGPVEEYYAVNRQSINEKGQENSIYDHPNYEAGRKNTVFEKPLNYDSSTGESNYADVVLAGRRPTVFDKPETEGFYSTIGNFNTIKYLQNNGVEILISSDEDEELQESLEIVCDLQLEGGRLQHLVKFRDKYLLPEISPDGKIIQLYDPNTLTATDCFKINADGVFKRANIVHKNYPANLKLIRRVVGIDERGNVSLNKKEDSAIKYNNKNIFVFSKKSEIESDESTTDGVDAPEYATVAYHQVIIDDSGVHRVLVSGRDIEFLDLGKFLILQNSELFLSDEASKGGTLPARGYDKEKFMVKPNEEADYQDPNEYSDIEDGTEIYEAIQPSKKTKEIELLIEENLNPEIIEMIKERYKDSFLKETILDVITEVFEVNGYDNFDEVEGWSEYYLNEIRNKKELEDEIYEMTYTDSEIYESTYSDSYLEKNLAKANQAEIQGRNFEAIANKLRIAAQELQKEGEQNHTEKKKGLLKGAFDFLGRNKKLEEQSNYSSNDTYGTTKPVSKIGSSPKKAAKESRPVPKIYKTDENGEIPLGSYDEARALVTLNQQISSDIEMLYKQNGNKNLKNAATEVLINIFIKNGYFEPAADEGKIASLEGWINSYCEAIIENEDTYCAIKKEETEFFVQDLYCAAADLYQALPDTSKEKNDLRKKFIEMEGTYGSYKKSENEKKSAFKAEIRFMLERYRNSVNNDNDIEKIEVSEIAEAGSSFLAEISKAKSQLKEVDTRLPTESSDNSVTNLLSEIIAAKGKTKPRKIPEPIATAQKRTVFSEIASKMGERRLFLAEESDEEEIDEEIPAAPSRSLKPKSDANKVTGNDMEDYYDITK